MSFNNYTLKQLKQILREAKGHHDLKYSKMNRGTLIKEMEKRFIIDGGNLYGYTCAGTLKNAGYVRKMEAMDKIIFNKIHNPSQYMIDKYGNQQKLPEPEPEPEHHHEHHHEAPLFEEHEVVDFNVAKEKPKKKITKSKTREPTEAEEEREEEKRRKELEHKKKVLAGYELLKKQVVECKNKLQKENNTYFDVLNEVAHEKGMKKDAREEKKQKVIRKHLANIKKIKDDYPFVYQYIKKHKLNENDLNEVHKYIRTQISKL